MRLCSSSCHSYASVLLMSLLSWLKLMYKLIKVLLLLMMYISLSSICVISVTIVMVYTDHKTVFRRRTVRKGRRNVKTGVRLIWHHEGGVGGPDCPRWGEVITVGHQPAPRTGHWPRLTDHAPTGGRGWGWHWTRPTYDAPTGGRGTMSDPPHD